MGANKLTLTKSNARIGANKHPRRHRKPLSQKIVELFERKEHTFSVGKPALSSADGELPAGAPPLTQRQPAGLGQSDDIIGFAALTASVACESEATHSMLPGRVRGFSVQAASMAALISISPSPS